MAVFNSLTFLCRCLSRQEKVSAHSSQIRHEISSGSVNWQEVIAIGDQHFVLPLLHAMLVNKGLAEVLPVELRKTLATLHGLNGQRNEQLNEQLTQIIELFNTIAVIPVLLKGSTALFSALYPDPACRMMNDLDILIPADKVETCAALLMEKGYAPMTCDDIYGNHHHGHPLIHPNWLARVELHSEIGAESVAQILRSDSIRNDAILIRRNGLQFKLCSNTHLALHNILHHQLSGSFLYRQRSFLLYQVYDMVQLMHQAGDTLLWEDISHLCKRHDCSRITASYFMLIKQLFHESLPPGFPASTGVQLDWLLTKTQLQHPLLQYYFQIAAHLLQNKKHRSIFVHQLCRGASYKVHFKRLLAQLKNT